MTEKIWVPVVGAVGLAVMSVGGYIAHKLNGLTRTYDTTVRNLDKVADKQIAEYLIKDAVDSAANKKVHEYVLRAHSDVMEEARTTIRKEVDTAVKAASKDITEKVTAEIQEKAAQIDMDSLQRSVRDKAEAKVLAKFDGGLQDILDKYDRNLSNVQKIYGSIADTLGRNNRDADGKLKFSIG